MILSPPPNDFGPNIGIKSSGNIASNLTSKKFITSDPEAFAEKLINLDNENEVLIVLKTTSAPRISKAYLEELPLGGKMVIALPETEANVNST